MDEKKLLKRKRSTAKGRFHRILNQFTSSFQENEFKEVLEQIMEDLEHAYSETEKGHASFIELLDSDDETDQATISQANSDMTVLYKELCKARIMMGKIIEATKTEDKKIKEVKPTHEKLRVRRLDSPTFSGNIREYPSFKQDFQVLMTESFGKDPFALKCCLTGEALLVVQGVDNDFDEMMRRLDIKYGKPEKLADAVLCEIRKLKPISDGDYGSFIATVDIVERCWLDLKRMHMESEMNTSTMTSQIEKLLPPIQKREWALRKQKPGPHLFAEFLNFLLEEKNAMEYMQSEIRVNCNSRVQKTKVHTLNLGEESTIESLQLQVKQNQEILKQVVDGLAHVAEVVSQGSRSKVKSEIGLKSNSSYKKNCWYHETDSHEISQCTAFARLDGQTKIDLIRRNGACYCCLKTGHISRQCMNRKACEVIDENQQRCGKMHHHILHGVRIDASSFHSIINIVNGDKGREGVILMISKVICNGNPITTLWDPGANISLITHESARRIGLKGRDVTLSVTKVGNSTECIHSKEYILPLTDMNGRIWQIRVYGMDEITGDVSKVDIQGVVKLFKGIKEQDIARPEGKVDLLIGTDCCVLLPTKIEQIGNLQLMKNQFGYCLRGSHALIRLSNSSNHHVVRIHHASIQPHEICSLYLVNCNGLKDSLDHFFDIESLGTHCSPKCGSCRCGKCPIGNANFSIAEERELSLIRKGLHYDRMGKCWTVSYPWKKEPGDLPNNVKSAVCRLASTEKRLQRVGANYGNAYHNQIMDMVNRNVARKLSETELNEYDGPIHYVAHHEVLKPDSKSTPIRIVFNSSASYMGHVLNDYWAKGPNVLNDLLTVLIRFRQGRVAIAGDISKMYNAIRLSVLDQHTHRFVWRDLDTERTPDHYTLLSVTFGDRPSGAIATVALRMTAEMCKEIYPMASEIIMRNSYVDDLLTSVDDVQDARQIIDETEKLLDYGGFKIKNWIILGDESDWQRGLHISRESQEKILGMIWQPKEDVFTFKAKINFSTKQRGVRTGKDLHKSQIDHIPKNLTRRMVLSQVSSIYDPLGLVTPFVLSAKVLMRSLCKNQENGEGWDDPMSEEMRQNWIDFFRGVFELESLKFPRCVKPDGAQGDPMLIIFADGSSIAYGTYAYIRWQTGTGVYDARLLIAKNRIAPTKQLSTPRLELCGAVLASRLSEKLVKEMDFRFTKVIHIVDSTIVRAQIQKESCGFGTFVATRIAEIQSKTEPSDWWWVPGDNNPADLTTRVT